MIWNKSTSELALTVIQILSYQSSSVVMHYLNVVLLPMPHQALETTYQANTHVLKSF